MIIQSCNTQILRKFVCLLWRSYSWIIKGLMLFIIFGRRRQFHKKIRNMGLIDVLTVWDNNKFVNSTFQFCVPLVDVCNGYDDCGDNSDEAPSNCLQCSDDEFECPVLRQCIRSSDVCNGVIDCAFGADEANCECILELFVMKTSRSTTPKLLFSCSFCNGSVQACSVHVLAW
jgi:hypothetical protein